MPNDYRARAQEITLAANPIARGERYDSLEIELVTTQNATALELALAMGRTEYGIESLRQRLAAGWAPRPAKPAERGYTFLPGDNPFDW